MIPSSLLDLHNENNLISLRLHWGRAQLDVVLHPDRRSATQGRRALRVPGQQPFWECVCVFECLCVCMTFYVCNCVVCVLMISLLSHDFFSFSLTQSSVQTIFLSSMFMCIVSNHIGSKLKAYWCIKHNLAEKQSLRKHYSFCTPFQPINFLLEIQFPR